jgi:N-acetyl-anhydromuramyl-L-alanine amidase AmpD
MCVRMSGADEDAKPQGCLYDGLAETHELTPEELAEVTAAADRTSSVAATPFPVVTSIRSRNFSQRPMRPPYGITLHHTGGRFAGDIATLTKPSTDPKRESVSANDYITKDGTIYELCEHPKRAWHAGDAVWGDITDVNSHFWGIEIENLGTAGDPYPQRQIDAVVWRCRERRRLLDITDPDMLTRHRDVCVPPGRKPDTSDGFPWEEVRRRVFAANDPTDGGATPDPGERPDFGQLEKYNVVGIGPSYGAIALAFAGALRAEGIPAMAIHNAKLTAIAADAAAPAVHRRGPRLVAIGPDSAKAVTAAGHTLKSETVSDLFGAVGEERRDTLARALVLLADLCTVEGENGPRAQERFRGALTALSRSAAADLPTSATVTPDSPLLAPERAPAQRVVARILRVPHGSYDDAAVSEIVGLYYTTCPPVDLDPLVASAQMIVETGSLSSEWASPVHKNPAGIGVTGEPGKGLTFPTWELAVRAHVGRLVAYAVPSGSETAAQRSLVEEALAWRPLPDDYRGKAPTLAGLVRRWAMDLEYANTISRVANEIIG